MIDRSSVGKFISLSWLCNFNRHPPMDDPNQRDFMHQYCFITWVCKWILYECLIPSFFMTKQLSSWRLNTQAIGNYFFFPLCYAIVIKLIPHISNIVVNASFSWNIVFFPFLSNLHKGRIIKELLNVKNNFFLKTLKNVQVTTTNKIMKYAIRRWLIQVF